jgi:hypothetical protein
MNKKQKAANSRTALQILKILIEQVSDNEAAIPILYVYEKEFRIACKKLNPQNDSDLNQQIAIAFWDAARIYLKIHTDESLDGMATYLDWQIAEFEQLPELQQAAWDGVSIAIGRMEKHFENFAPGA